MEYMWMFIVGLLGIGIILIAYFKYREAIDMMSSVKSDTSNVLPKIDAINENVKNINKYIIDDIKGNVQNIQNLSYKNNEDIKLIAEDVKYRQRLNRENKDTFTGDNLVNDIDDIYRYSIGTLGQSSSNSIFRLDDFDIDKTHFDNCILVPKVIDGEKYMLMIRGKKAAQIIKIL